MAGIPPPDSSPLGDPQARSRAVPESETAQNQTQPPGPGPGPGRTGTHGHSHCRGPSPVPPREGEGRRTRPLAHPPPPGLVLRRAQSPLCGAGEGEGGGGEGGPPGPSASCPGWPSHTGPAHPRPRVAAATLAPLGSHPPAGAWNEWNVPGAQGGSAGGRGRGAGAGPEPRPPRQGPGSPTWTQGAQGPSAGLQAGPGLEDIADQVGELLGHSCSEKACPGPSLCPRGPQVWYTSAPRYCVCHQGELDQSLPPALKPAQIPCAGHHPRSCPRTPLGGAQRETSILVLQTHPHPG